MDHTPDQVVARLRPLLVAVRDSLSAGVAVSRSIHAQRGWSPTADRHLDHQLVRREAMERLKPWEVGLDEPEAGPLAVRQLELLDTSTDNLGLPMSGLILHTPTDLLRIWHSDDGELPAAATDGLRAFYQQAPTRQTQLAIDVGALVPVTPANRLALLWADAPGDRPGLVRLDLVRPAGHVGRRAEVDWHVDLLPRLPAPR